MRKATAAAAKIEMGFGALLILVGVVSLKDLMNVLSLKLDLEGNEIVSLKMDHD